MEKQKIEALTNHILAECEKQGLTVEEVLCIPGTLKRKIDANIRAQKYTESGTGGKR